MSEVKKIATRESYGNALVELGKLHDDVVVLDADLAGATKQDVHSNRFVTLSDIRRTMLRSVLHMQVFPLVKMVLPISATKISLL